MKLNISSGAKASLWSLSIMMLAMATTSCGSKVEPKVTEEIPDNVAMIKRLDFPALFKAMGDTEPFTPEDALKEDARRLIELTILPDFRAPFTSLLAGGALDMANTIAFTTNRGEEVMIIPVSDKSKLFAGIPSDSITSDNDGYTAIRIGGMSVVTIDGKCWIAPSEEVVKRTRQEAAKSHIGYLPGVREFIQDSHAANLAVNCGNSPLSFLGDEENWFCVHFDANTTAVNASAVVMNRDGELDSIGKNFQEIDTDFLRYTPGEASIVLAFGKFDGNEKGLQYLLGRYAPLYLAECDGTTSLYAMPAGSAEAVRDNQPGAWNVQCMTHLPQNLLEEGIRQYREASGNTARQVDGQWTYTLGNDTYYFGVFDNDLIFASNREISSDYNNPFTTDFTGKKAAISVTIPADGILRKAWGLPSGVVLKMGLESMILKARISFPGSESTPLSTLLHLPQLPELRSRFGAITGE